VCVCVCCTVSCCGVNESLGLLMMFDMLVSNTVDPCGLTCAASGLLGHQMAKIFKYNSPHTHTLQLTHIMMNEGVSQPVHVHICNLNIALFYEAECVSLFVTFLKGLCYFCVYFQIKRATSNV